MMAATVSASTARDTYHQRLLNHTEVFSHVLSFTDRPSLLSCLRVSQRIHEISQLHIHKVYNHVTIDRDSIKSVFEGISWEDLEEKWTDEDVRSRIVQDRRNKVWGKETAHNRAKKVFSYQALFEGTDWADMDEQWKSPKQSRDGKCHDFSIAIQPNLQCPAYGSSKTDRHARKVYALSKCKIVTLCDTWTTTGRDSRYHTHNVLHNGKAHQLFPKVETVRVIPLTSAIKHVTPLCSAHGSCPFIEEMMPRKLVHRNVTANGFSLTSDSVEELVLFLPNKRRPDDMEYSYRIEALEERLIGVKSGTIKLVFGPPLVGNNRSERHIPIPTWFKPEERNEGGGDIPLDRLIDILRTACSESKTTHIYGLETTRVLRSDIASWFSSQDRTKTLSYAELLKEVKSQLLERREEDYDDPVTFGATGPFNNFRIHRLDEYVTSGPYDELLDHELDGTECWDWNSTDFWSRRAAPRKVDVRAKTVGIGSGRGWGRRRGMPK